MSPKRVSVGEAGEGNSGKERKGAGANSGKSGTRNLEVESIKSRAESMGVCVELKTDTEIRFSPISSCPLEVNGLNYQLVLLT